MTRKKTLLAITIILSLAIAAWWILSTHSTNSAATETDDRMEVAAGTSSTSTKARTNTDQSTPTSYTTSGEVKPAQRQRWLMPEQAELWSLRTTHSLLGALRSENAASRAFAAYMPTGLCLAASMAGGFGHSTLEADFPTKPVPFTASDRKRIEATCARVHHQEKLRGTVLAALKEQQAPMTSFFKATDGSPSAARAQLARVLADEDPTALFPLNIVWPLYNTERMAETVPQELRMYSQGIVAAAFDIALCRSAAYCGPDGFPREQVCARFGECDEPDVESAYRRLHSEAGIPFAVTSNMADWIRDAIARRDTLALWPDTVKFPTRRK